MSRALHQLVGGMSLPKTGANHYHAQLGLLRQTSCNQRVGCLMGVTQLNTPGVEQQPRPCEVLLYELSKKFILVPNYQIIYFSSQLSDNTLIPFLSFNLGKTKSFF